MRYLLDEHKKNNSSEYYLKIRSVSPETLSDVQKAARFIYLNKTGFNGLYRLNKSGQFNVPWNKEINKNLYTEESFEATKRYLESSKGKFYCEDYLKTLQRAKKGDFVFVDPPYDGDGVFKEYTKDGFSKEDQKALANALNELTKRGVKWILCNYDTPLIQELYKNNNKMILSAKRSISVDGEKRNNAYKEVFYFNYEVKDFKIKSEVSEFISTLKLTNRSLDFYVDWRKASKQADEHRYNLMKLSMLLNYSNLTELKDRIKFIFDKGDQDCFSSLDILIAKRNEKEEDNIYLDSESDEIKEINLSTPTGVYEFIDKTGLKSLLKSVTNLEDYVFGVEVGMDTNARKNRSGKFMENEIAGILNKRKIPHKIQVKNENIKGLENINTTKKFDFVFKFKGKNYVVESSFYNSGGSKQFEVSTSYINLTNDLKNKNFELIWLLDGGAMRTFRPKLEKSWGKVKIMNLNQFQGMLDN